MRGLGRLAATAAVTGLVALAGACSAGTTSASSSTSTTVAGRSAAPPPIRHVWVIMLENEGYDATFGDPAADPYLAKTLVGQGALLEQYYAIGHFSNDNYLALLSGQPPTPDTQGDCQNFVDFPAGAGLGPGGIQTGNGCVYPADVATLPTQLAARGLTWKGYMQDMGNDPAREATTCAHPAVGAADHTQVAVAGDGYATRHDPFVYFHAIIDDTTTCQRQVVPLGTPSGAMPAGVPAGVTGLAHDLRRVATTPNFSFITPNLCADGHDFPCVNQAGGASALADVDAFLQTWVPRIEASPAFKANGLIDITFDEADTGDATACCGEQPGPAAPQPGLSGPGGGRIGTVLISPFIRPGTRSSTPYNHYAALASLEDLFGLPRLGEAADVPAVFGRDVYTAPAR